MNYRKLYESVYGEIPKDEYGVSFEIHHKDGNHSNNSIENLVALSIQDHYNIHFEQCDFNACGLIAIRMGGLSVEDEYELRSLISEWMRTNNPSAKARGESHWARGTAVVIDSYGNKIRVAIDDPRIISGEFVHINANKATVRDVMGNCFSVQRDDPRIISGELVPASKGYKRTWTPEQTAEIYASRRGRQWSDEERARRAATRRYPCGGRRRGSHHTEETKMKMSIAKKGTQQQQVICPHCNKSGGKPAMARFHFDNCKLKGTSCASL